MNDKEGRKWLLQKLYDNGIKYIAYSPFYGGHVGMKETPRISDKGEVFNHELILITLGDILPDFNEPNWLDIGKYLGIIDWSKIPVDAPIKVQRGNGVVINRHFATFDNGEVYYYRDGRTSWSDVGRKSVSPKKVILAGGDDEN
jgi:hypothetical protein